MISLQTFCLACSLFFNELLFFMYLKNIHTISFSLDNDVWERRNVVYIYF